MNAENNPAVSFCLPLQLLQPSLSNSVAAQKRDTVEEGDKRGRWVKKKGGREFAGLFGGVPSRIFWWAVQNNV